ncbi:DUF551 domain-containing protein [Klebsiella aerogenes]|uniref:DUF551 domain-containing protein n=1 Tax=Klebsiella aerogenes TaxID=548 RepID=UPI00397C78DB
MTKSTITIEQITAWMNDANYALEEPLSADDAAAARAILAMGDELLAAMDSEPVCFVSERNLATLTKYRAAVKVKAEPVMVRPVALYRHAQPAPVVQCPYPCGWDNLNKLAIQDAALVARGLVGGEPTTEAQRQAAISNNDRLLKVISACRAAMLQAEPVTTANKLPFEQWLSQQTGTIDVECGCVMTEVFFHWLRVAYEAGNSPVIPDTWIPVSERMSENKPGRYEYLVFEKLNNRVNHDYWNVPNAGDDTFTPFWNHYGEYVTHWMPLPAAPQEVKGE